MTTPREKAEDALGDVHNYSHPTNAVARAITGVGWAVLDLANAIRESPTEGDRP